MARRTHRLSMCDECCRVVIALAAALMSFACMFVAASLPTVEWLLFRMVPFLSSVPHRLRVALGSHVEKTSRSAQTVMPFLRVRRVAKTITPPAKPRALICHSYAQDACARCSMRSDGLRLQQQQQRQQHRQCQCTQQRRPRPRRPQPDTQPRAWIRPPTAALAALPKVWCHFCRQHPLVHVL